MHFNLFVHFVNFFCYFVKFCSILYKMKKIMVCNLGYLRYTKLDIHRLHGDPAKIEPPHFGISVSLLGQDFGDPGGQ